MNLRDQLQAIAEQIAGGRVFVDVTYRVSAESGPFANYTSGPTAEGALAAFIAELLECQPERLAPLEKSVVGLAPTPSAPPASQNGAGLGRANKALGVANRERVRELHASGMSGPEIIRETGLASSCVYGHLKAIREEAAAADNQAGFCEND